MLQTFTQILPLEVGQIFSPGILALVLLLLGSQIHPRARTTSFFLGSLVVGVLLTYLGAHLGLKTPETHQTNISAIIDISLGAILIILGLVGFFSKEKQIKVKSNQTVGYLKWFAAGFIISITNFDAVLMNFTAAKTIGADADTDEAGKIALLAINIFFFVLIIVVPILFYLFAPKTAHKLLAPLSNLALKYSRFIVAFILIAMAIYFLVKGIGFFS